MQKIGTVNARCQPNHEMLRKYFSGFHWSFWKNQRWYFTRNDHFTGLNFAVLVLWKVSLCLEFVIQNLWPSYKSDNKKCDAFLSDELTVSLSRSAFSLQNTLKLAMVFAFPAQPSLDKLLLLLDGVQFLTAWQQSFFTMLTNMRASLGQTSILKFDRQRHTNLSVLHKNVSSTTISYYFDKMFKNEASILSCTNPVQMSFEGEGNMTNLCKLL